MNGKIGAKQIIVLRKDLNMRKGKMIAQGAHASMAVLLDEMKKQVKGYSVEGHLLSLDLEPGSAMSMWVLGSFKKIAVSVDSEEELLALKAQCDALGHLNALIQDSGLTEFGGVPTYTALAIGPLFEEEFIGLTDHLKLL